MKFNIKDFEYIQNLVGNITENDLSCVDVYIHNKLGIFIPSIGFCKYAIKQNHTHPSYSFIIPLCEDDFFIKCNINIPENYYFCCAMSPHIPHEETISENFHRYIAIFIDEKFFKHQISFYTEYTDEKYFWTQFSVNKNIISYIKNFMTEYEECYNNKNAIMDSLSILITNEIIRNLITPKYNRNIQTNNNEILKAVHYINNHFNDKITVKTLCSLTSMSESNFNKLFKKETEMSPIKYLINVRIQKAKKYLRDTNLSITEVSLKCGFYSISHFSSCFMNIVSLSPTEYQNIFNNK